MKPSRRRFLQFVGAAAASTKALRVATAQTYPTRPVRWVVGFPAGGAADMAVRLIAEPLSGKLGQQVFVDNRPGAGTNIATEALVRAPADGYTLLLVTPANAVNATLYENLPFNFMRDIAPVAGLNRAPMIMVINPSLPITTVAEFIAYAKAHPGKLSMATGGNGTVSQMTAGLFNMMTGITATQVPYRGEAPAITDLIGGQVHVMFITLTSALEHIRTGKLRALAVTPATRSEVLPDVPSVSDFVPGFASSTWNGVGAPKNTPAEIIDRLNREINAILAYPQIQERFVSMGATTLSISVAEFGNLVGAETEKWAKVVKFLGIKPI